VVSLCCCDDELRTKARKETDRVSDLINTASITYSAALNLRYLLLRKIGAVSAASFLGFPLLLRFLLFTLLLEGGVMVSKDDAVMSNEKLMNKTLAIDRWKRARGLEILWQVPVSLRANE